MRPLRAALLIVVLALLGATAATAAQPGAVQYRLDAASWFDKFSGETGWITAHLDRMLAYPSAGDKYTGLVPTLAYHDAYTSWGAGNLNPTHRAEYVAWVKRDREHGYAGQFMDDVEWSGSGQHIAGSDSETLALIEAVRGALGPEGVLELNTQWVDLWPRMQAHNAYVEAALTHVNMIDKEFGVSSSSGIGTPGRYAEYLAYVAALEAKGVHIDQVSSPPGDEYALATYLLLNDGGPGRGSDFIGAHAEPPGWWSGFDSDLGEAAYRWSNGRPAPARHEPNGAWRRFFKHGEAIVDPPGNAAVTYGAVTLHERQGAVIRW